jgi:hypothetical protein
MPSPLRIGSLIAVTIVLLTTGACSSSSSGAAAPQAADSGTACTASLGVVFAASKCPADANGAAVNYDTAITTTCEAQGLTTGAIKYGQCLDYLVWEQDDDSSGHDFSKCFYDVKTHALVGIVFDDGTQDQCNKTSFAVQAGSAEAYCSIAGLDNGGSGRYQACGAAPADAGNPDVATPADAGIPAD